MSSKFLRDEQGFTTITFTTQESQVLINLLEQLLELLGDSSVTGDHSDPLMNLFGSSGNDAPPDDPVLRRLLPNAYSDESDAAEFRRYTESGLREKKRSAAHIVYEALLPSELQSDTEWNSDQPVDRSIFKVVIDSRDIQAWLTTLNDLRLALAVRLGIGERSAPDDSTEKSKQRFELMTDNDPMKAVYAVYSWLGWLQQSLLELLIDGDEK